MNATAKPISAMASGITRLPPVRKGSSASAAVGSNARIIAWSRYAGLHPSRRIPAPSAHATRGATAWEMVKVACTHAGRGCPRSRGRVDNLGPAP